jgi:Sec7-like guanine-nucleotide exchange factor
MMLHTDAFNKSNKNKMTKADYVKNTRMGGIPPEVLDVSILSHVVQQIRRLML